jgi:hypothetical protein
VITLLKNHERTSDRKLVEFNMDTISLLLADKGVKPVHAPSCTVPRAVEQQSRTKIMVHGENITK